MATKRSFSYNYNDTNNNNNNNKIVSQSKDICDFVFLKFRQPSTKCSRTTTIFVEKLTNLS